MNRHSLYMEFGREEWAALRDHTPLPLTKEEFERLKGLNDQIPFEEAEQIYHPITRLINLHVAASQQLYRSAVSFTGSREAKTPFIIGIAGSVAVGKSTAARLLQLLLSRWTNHRNVDLVTTDGFLHPNRILQERGLMKRKGFPESYDIKRLLQFLTEVKAGKPEVSAPVYSHLVYDVIPDRRQVVRNPDILIVEGINVLQVSKEARVFVSDFFDFSIYLDADERDIEQWYIERFRMLRDSAFRDPQSYFHRYATLTEEQSVQTATQIWNEINAVNLRENILPSKGRARLLLHKGSNHEIRKVLLRK
ncbi:type I pantothenate kinase [Paenibacillus hemerocallicola]|uniref:Pantothenate kinase n=1 Tax=Paenibacillus hemerocallicola TaxID=1172614 RepID=A0A5C4SWE4_9BACL|nr:type I pantothenate kinase [Paenibacillus hemerocallicola]TNJ56292.1 type I pantothenate kinase [Paenibacillus hemerocallicola]